MHYPNPQVHPFSIQCGSLVRSRLNNLGVGKVLSISESKAVVEYFVSIGKRIQETLPLKSLEGNILQRHTRCYLWSGN